MKKNTFNNSLSFSLAILMMACSGIAPVTEWNNSQTGDPSEMPPESTSESEGDGEVSESSQDTESSPDPANVGGGNRAPGVSGEGSSTVDGSCNCDAPLYDPALTPDYWLAATTGPTVYRYAADGTPRSPFDLLSGAPLMTAVSGHAQTHVYAVVSKTQNPTTYTLGIYDSEAQLLGEASVCGEKTADDYPYFELTPDEERPYAPGTSEWFSEPTSLKGASGGSFWVSCQGVDIKMNSMRVKQQGLVYPNLPMTSIHLQSVIERVYLDDVGGTMSVERSTLEFPQSLHDKGQARACKISSDSGHPVYFRVPNQGTQTVVKTAARGDVEDFLYEKEHYYRVPQGGSFPCQCVAIAEFHNLPLPSGGQGQTYCWDQPTLLEKTKKGVRFRDGGSYRVCVALESLMPEIEARTDSVAGSCSIAQCGTGNDRFSLCSQHRDVFHAADFKASGVSIQDLLWKDDLGLVALFANNGAEVYSNATFDGLTARDGRSWLISFNDDGIVDVVDQPLAQVRDIGVNDRGQILAVGMQGGHILLEKTAGQWMELGRNKEHREFDAPRSVIGDRGGRFYIADKQAVQVLRHEQGALHYQTLLSKTATTGVDHFFNATLLPERRELVVQARDALGEALGNYVISTLPACDGAGLATLGLDVHVGSTDLAGQSIMLAHDVEPEAAACFEEDLPAFPTNAAGVGTKCSPSGIECLYEQVCLFFPGKTHGFCTLPCEGPGDTHTCAEGYDGPGSAECLWSVGGYGSYCGVTCEGGVCPDNGSECVDAGSVRHCDPI
jgi:hypothetical protein